MKFLALLTALIFVFPEGVRAKEAYFYHHYPYGSEANFNPLSLIANSSFDILQIGNVNNDLRNLQFANGWKNVEWNLTHARGVIRRRGAGEFISSEVFPSGLSLKNAQYWPNYKLHLLGGGMSYVMTAEWYDQHGCSWPRTLSALTMAALHLTNEAVENGGYRGGTVDPIADLMIFDPAGIALFSIPAVPRFFSHTLRMADWSFQPMVDLADGELLNNGQKFSYKFPLPYTERFRFFYLTGTEGMAGLTWRKTATDDLTFGGGLAADKLVEVDDVTGSRKQTVNLVYTGGIFYDRNNSLLASLIVGGPRGYLARLNIYPGVLHLGTFSPGAALMVQNDGGVALGIFTPILPLGAAVGG